MTEYSRDRREPHRGEEEKKKGGGGNSYGCGAERRWTLETTQLTSTDYVMATKTLLFLLLGRLAAVA